jgi:Zn-dependent M28 family amino/carboxypeptidase
VARPLRVLVLAAVLAAPAACAGRLEVDGARAQARVVFQVAAGPRVPGTAAHARILDWLTGELSRLGGRVERQSFVDSTLGRPLALTNVIARFGPGTEGPAGRAARGATSPPWIVLCAHWDSRAGADQDPDPAYRQQPVPGANDGASGVAVLLEVAELMSRQRPPVGVDLVFFDGEDQGRASEGREFCLGARYYARRLTATGERPLAAFLFDMVGDRDLEIHPEAQSAARAANLVALVLESARAVGAVHFKSEPGSAITDDHVPLLDAGIPAVDIIDFDYPAWHTRRDLPDQTSSGSLAEVARVAAWIVYRSPLARSGR